MGGMPLELREGEALRCHIFVDGPYVESCCNNQTNRFDWGESRANGTRLIGTKPAAAVDVWQLQLAGTAARGP